MSRYAVLEALPSVTDAEEASTAPARTVGENYQDGMASLSYCEIDPDMYRVFAYAVLGWHRRMPKAGGDMCQCGKSWLYCEYVDLADKLLWTGVGSWTTQSG
jgi:hypothetical protein